VHILVHPLSNIVTFFISTVHSGKFSKRGPWHLQLLLVGFANVGIVLQRVWTIFLGYYGCLHFPLGEREGVVMLRYTRTVASVLDVIGQPAFFNKCQVTLVTRPN
jgi:hypothetical protein